MSIVLRCWSDGKKKYMRCRPIHLLGLNVSTEDLPSSPKNGQIALPTVSKIEKAQNGEREPRSQTELL
jgi:hypothetical protein